MRKLTPILAFTACLAQAQQFTQSLYYDFKTKESGTAIQTPIRKFENVLGKNLTLDLNAMVGVYFDSGNPFTGFSVTYTREIAKDVTFHFGPACTVQNGQPFSIGLVAGVRF